MAQTIQCPHCTQGLQLPEEFIGKSVKCPECQKAFRAELPAAPPGGTPPPLPGKDDKVPEWEKKPKGATPPPDDADDRDDRPRKKKKGPATSGRGSYFDPLTQRYRKKEPHRGMLILTLGILSFVICPPIMGPIAYYWAGTDLAEMNDGRMDESGLSMTKTGRILGLASTALFALTMVLGCCGMIGMMAMSRP